MSQIFSSISCNHFFKEMYARLDFTNILQIIYKYIGAKMLISKCNTFVCLSFYFLIVFLLILFLSLPVFTFYLVSAIPLFLSLYFYFIPLSFPLFFFHIYFLSPASFIYAFLFSLSSFSFPHFPFQCLCLFLFVSFFLPIFTLPLVSSFLIFISFSNTFFIFHLSFFFLSFLHVLFSDLQGSLPSCLPRYPLNGAFSEL